VHHILIVEDEEHMGIGIKYNLEAEGHRVTLVTDGPTALRLIEADRQAVHLVILDLMLPGMSGYAVCERIRDWGLDTPILMLSARTLSEDRKRGFDVGTNQYVSKPFDLEELISRVNNLLRLGGKRDKERETTVAKPNPTSVDRVEVGAVAVDFHSHQVLLHGEPIRLSSKDLRVLKYFAQHPGRVISRSELLAEVWGLRGKLQTRAVDQCIVRLRKVLEEDPAEPKYLLTIRDAGYRFVTS
jgi:DNA-binding response OmpR family regulator